MNWDNKIKNFKAYFSLQYLGIYAIAIQYLFQYDFFFKPSSGLDNSWALSINLALKENLKFGSDYIFTYGPLGYLSTSIPIYASYFAIFTFNIFIILNGLYFIYYVQKQIESKLFKVLFYLVIFYFNFLFIDRSGILLLFYFQFHMFCYIKNKKLISLIISSIIVAISFYIKVNTGIIATFLFFSHIVFFNLNKIGNRIHFLFGILLILFSHIILNSVYQIDVISYFKNSMDIINYYNDAMVTNFPVIITYIAFCIIIIFLSYIFFVIEIWKSKYDSYLFINLFLILFIIFKQSFVRADIYHYSTFFYSVIYLLLIIYTFTSSLKIKNYTIKIIPIVVLLCSFVPLIKPGSKTYTSDIITKILFYKKDQNKKNENKKNEKILPLKFLNKIGDKTTDVVPSEISWIYFNNLRYNPRPIPQSYSAYSDKLMRLNYSKYLSNNSPEFVLYHNNGFIDNHFPLWEDSYVQLALLQHYKIVDTTNLNSDSLILFKKQETVSKINKKLLLDTIIELNNIITLPKTNKILFMECNLNYSLMGNIRRVLFQTANLTVDMKNSNENYFTSYNGILPLLNAGVIINKSIKLYNTEDYATYSDFIELNKFFKSKGEDSQNIYEIKFVANKNYFVNRFRVKFWEYSF
jgi:hypothetical protein